MFLSFTSLQPFQIPNYSHHLPVYGTTLCMTNWYGWISKYEALTKLCKLTDHVFTLPVMLVNSSKKKHRSMSTINTTQVDPTKSDLFIINYQSPRLQPLLRAERKIEGVVFFKPTDVISMCVRNYPFICIVVEETRDGMWSQKYICQTLFVPPFQSFNFRYESNIWRMWSLKIHLFNFE